MSDERLRLFLALWPDVAVCCAIEDATQGAVAASGGRAVPRANYHLTLVFLGDQPVTSLADIRRAVGSVPPPIGTLRLDRLGSFRHAGVLWLGPALTPTSLARCVHDLREALATCGVEWPSESSRFRAHVTLARRIRHPLVAARCVPVVWHHAGLSLIVSKHETGGYSVLDA